jgi:AcrR family transcriptional regulator
VTTAEVTKRALYAHFRSKLALATALVEHHLEVSCHIGAKADRAGARRTGNADRLRLPHPSGRRQPPPDPEPHSPVRIGRPLQGSAGQDGENWVRTFADIAERGVVEGDIRPDCHTEHVARLLTSLHLGLRQTSNLDDAEQFIGDLEAVLLLALPGFANPERLAYLTGFIRRRSALAIKNAAPLGANKL